VCARMFTEGMWLVSRDRVKLSALPVATVSCQLARLVLLSMNVDIQSPTSANFTRRQRCKIFMIICLGCV